MGGPVWACFVGLFFTSQKQLQSNEKQTNTTTAKDIFFIVFSVYRDMKNKRQKQDHRTPKKQRVPGSLGPWVPGSLGPWVPGQSLCRPWAFLPGNNKFAYIIRYQNFLQKISKKICKFIFLLYICTSETKNKRPC